MGSSIYDFYGSSNGSFDSTDGTLDGLMASSSTYKRKRAKQNQSCARDWDRMG
jgi:hypothetical protein